MAQTVSNTLHSPLSLTAASQNPLLIQGIGGIVLNSGSATSAIYGDASQAWIVVNEGIVAVADTFSYGIDLAAGGYVGNYQKYGGSALISAGTGVYMGGPGTVRNFSSITGVTGYGVSVVAGYVVNLESFANISGKRGGVLMSFNDSTVGNDGTIAGTGTAGIGVSFLRGGTLINLGTISGAGAAAQFAGTYASRLILYPGAAFENGSGGPGRVSASTTGGGSSNALELANGRGETGTITGLGSLFTGFYAVTVGAGASWVISGQNTIGTGVPTLALTVYGALTNQSNFVASGFDGAIDLDGGSLLNAALATLGGIGGFAVIGQSSAATVVNLGTMYRNIGDGYAVSLTAGGAMTNGSATNSTAAITGGAGAYLALAGTVTNYGTIAGFGPGNSLSAGSGIEFHAGGSLINGSAPGAVASIYGTATGVFAPGAAPLAISNYGAITGRHTGIVLGGDATLTNAGRISGGNGTAVVLGGSAANRLIVSPFGSFGGIVTGSTTAGASNTLELASATVAGNPVRPRHKLHGLSGRHRRCRRGLDARRHQFAGERRNPRRRGQPDEFRFAGRRHRVGSGGRADQCDHRRGGLRGNRHRRGRFRRHHQFRHLARRRRQRPRRFPAGGRNAHQRRRRHRQFRHRRPVRRHRRQSRGAAPRRELHRHRRRLADARRGQHAGTGKRPPRRHRVGHRHRVPQFPVRRH